MNTKIIFAALLFLFTLLSAGCAADDSAGDYSSSNNVNNSGYENNLNNSNNGGNVNIGGVQDIGLFRDIIEAGDIPSPDTLTANGFFSEHYLEYPFGSCDERLCLNGMIGRGTSLISNDYMNVLQVVMKSYVDPSEYERPATDFIAVIDISGSMYSEDKLNYVKEGLHLMVDKLNPDDRLSIVAYSDWATEIQPLTFADGFEAKEAMHASVSSLLPSGSTNIYDALDTAFEVATQSEADGRYARVVFLSDGVPTSGITDQDSILTLARESVSDTVQLTSIGVGYDLNFDLMKELAMAGGNFYFIENGSSLTDIFVQELDFFAFPIAKDILITLTSGASFYAGDAVGFDQWNSTGGGGSAYIPSVYAASRVSSSTEDPTARRGGGSALFVRLVAENTDRDLSGMQLTLQYEDPETGGTVVQDLSISSLAGGDGIVPVDAYYSEDVMRKSFLMLNLYLALKSVCEKAVYYSYDDARVLLEQAISHATEVNDDLQDEDITNDIALMTRLLNNMGYGYGDDYYCENGYCCEDGYCYEDGYYEDDCYYEDESVDYGCSTSGSPRGALPMVVAFLLGLALIRRKNALK